MVESDWLVEIQLNVTCARQFSRRALTLPFSGLARKGSSSTDYKVECSKLVLVLEYLFCTWYMFGPAL